MMQLLLAEGIAIPIVLIRVFLIGYLLIDLPDHFMGLHGVGGLPEEFMARSFLVQKIPLPFPFPELHIDTYHTVMLELGCLVILGLFTRVALAIFTFGYAYLLGVESAWGWHDHGPSLIIQILAVLVIAPGLNCCSITNLWAWARRRIQFKNIEFDTRRDFIGAAQPLWGFFLICILVSTFYLASGTSKLRFGGFHWLNGQPLAFYLSGISRSNQLQQYGSRVVVPASERWRDGFGIDFYLYGANPSSLGKYIGADPLYRKVGACAATFFEILYPLMLFGGRFRFFMCLSAALFHLSVISLMGISFMPWVVLNFCLMGPTIRSRSD